MHLYIADIVIPGLFARTLETRELADFFWLCILDPK
jgi:hypothetical protein